MSRPRAFLLLAALPLLAGAALSLSETPEPETDVASPGTVSPGSAAQRAWIDPDTGRLGVPSEAELAAEEELAPRAGLLAERLRVDSEGLWERPLASGGYRVHLGGRFSSATVATVGPDGRLVTRCVHGGVAHDAADHPEGEDRHDH